MANFESVIRRSLEGLAERSIETREHLYVTAFAAVDRQLRSMTPRPSENMIRKQLHKLKDAVIVVEADFGEDLAQALADRAIRRTYASRLQRNAVSLVFKFTPPDLATDFVLNLEDLHAQRISQLGEPVAGSIMRQECISFICRYHLGRVSSLISLLRRVIFRSG